VTTGGVETYSIIKGGINKDKVNNAWYYINMKIHSISIRIQDVITSDNVPVVAGFTDIYLDNNEIMLDDEGNQKLTEEGLPQKKFEKVSATWLLSQNVILKREIQKMVITAITQYDIEQRKAKGEELNFDTEMGLGISKPKRGANVTKAKKRK
jgi:hypothetical protein